MIHSFIQSTQLVRFSVGNYRSFKDDVAIDLAPLNLVFGGNSSGKSRLLRFLPYLMKCISESDFTSKNSLAEVLSHTFGKQFGDNIRFSYDLLISFNRDKVDNDIYECRYRVEVGFSLIDGFDPYSSSAFDSSAEWSLLDKTFKVTYLTEGGIWKNVYESTLHLDADSDFISGETRPDDVYTTNHIFFNYNHPLSWRYLNEKFENEKKKHRWIHKDSAQKKVYLDIFEQSESLETKHSYTLNDLFESDDLNFSVYPVLANSIGTIHGRLHPLHPFTKRQNIEFYLINHAGFPYGTGDFRRHTKDVERTQNVYQSFFDSISFLTRDFVSHVNIDYTSGIRSLPSYSGKVSTLVDLPDRIIKSYRIIDDSAAISHPSETSLEYYVDAINHYLGPAHLNTGYCIHHETILEYDDIESLFNTILSKGLNTKYIQEFLNTDGYLDRYQLFDQSNNIKVNMDEVGLGITQVLPIVSRLAVANDALLIFEQPELHLHPGMQTGLAKLIVHSAKTRGNRFLIETHSEHLIKAIQLEVARHTSTGGQEGLSRDDINVLYTRRDPKHKSSTIRKIELDPFGSFTEPWPDDFFDAGADLTMERLRMMNPN
jgi:predicted ATPase